MGHTYLYSKVMSACQYLSCQILKFQDSACQILKFQYFACQILKFQYFACRGIYWPVQKSERLVLYPGDSRIIQEARVGIYMYFGDPGFHRFRANGSVQYSTYCNQYSWLKHRLEYCAWIIPSMFRMYVHCRLLLWCIWCYIIYM